MEPSAIEPTELLKTIPIETVHVIISVASGLFGALLGFLFGYCASRSMQRREWRKRDLQNQHNDIEILESCIIAVKHEISHNHSLMERKHEDYIAGSWGDPMFELSTASFDTAWPVFVTKRLFAERQKQFQVISSLFREYVHVNLTLQRLRHILAPIREVSEETKLALSGLVRESLQKRLKDRALRALDEMQEELASRKDMLKVQLRRL